MVRYVAALVAALHFSLAAGAQVSAPDAFEPNDSADSASWIPIFETQIHTFHDEGDEDWLRFFFEGGSIVTIRTVDLGSDADTYIELYDLDGDTLLDSDDDSNPDAIGRGEDRGSLIVYTLIETGLYFLRVRTAPGALIESPFGENAIYEVLVEHEIGPTNFGSIDVFVRDGDTLDPVVGAMIELRSLDTFTAWSLGKTDQRGEQAGINLSAGTYAVKASKAPDYTPDEANVILTGGDSQEVTLELERVIQASVSVNPTTIRFPAGGASESISIFIEGIPDTAWNAAITSGGSWLNLDPPNGSASGEVIATASANSASIERSGGIEVSLVDFPDQRVQVAVSQAARGDINLDGTLDAVDVQLAILDALGLPSDFSGDTNGDGITDAIDVQLVINAVLGI